MGLRYSKTGKTTAACTAPGTLILVNTDLPNATRFARRRQDPGRILEVKMPQWEKGQTQQVMDLLAEISVMCTSDDRPDTVVIDPIGELHRRMLEDFSGRAVRPRIDYYGDVSMQVERFCRFMCEAPVNFVIVAHEFAVGSGELIEKVAFTGTKGGSETLSQKLMGMVDIVGYCGSMQVEGGERKYVAQLVQEHGRQGGDRFDVIAGENGIADLNLTEWFTKAGIHTGMTTGAKA